MSSHEQIRQLHRYREILLAAEADQSNQFDKTIIALSGGALALSVTLLGGWKISPDWMLVSSWFFYVCSLCATLFSFKVAERQHKRDVEFIDEALRSGDNVRQEDNIWSWWVLRLNEASALGFLVGTVLFLFFIFGARAAIGPMTSP